MCYMPAELGKGEIWEFRGPIGKDRKIIVSRREKDENFKKLTAVEQRAIKMKEIEGANEYFIINEIYSSEKIRTFSGARIIRDEGDENGKEDENGYKKIAAYKDLVCIKYIERKLFEEKVLDKLNIRGKNIETYYEDLLRSLYDLHSLKKTAEEKKIKLEEHIIRLEDIIITDTGLFFVEEPFEFSFYDYVNAIREPLKNSKYPIEIKLRPVIQLLLENIEKLHALGLCFCGALNPHEIQIKEKRGDEKTKIQVKLPNPILAKVLTLMDLVPNEVKEADDPFISYFPPEIYRKLKSSTATEERLANLSQFNVKWEELMPLFNQNFDNWVLGCFLYELIFGSYPFKYTDINDAIKKSSNPKTMAYVVSHKKISLACLTIIDECLRNDPRDRLQSVIFKKLIKQIANENKNKETLERDLKERYEMVTGPDYRVFKTTSKVSQMPGIDEDD